MEYVDDQRLPDDVSAIHRTLLRTANHHFPFFAPNVVVQAMIKHCEDALSSAIKSRQIDKMMLLNKRIRELEPHAVKPVLGNTAQGEILRYEMILHFRACMESLIAHQALAEVWNQSAENPWEDRLRMRAASYLETESGTIQAAQMYFTFNSAHGITLKVRNGFEQCHNEAIELLREMIPHWQTID